MELIMECAVQVAATLLITLIGVLGTYLTVLFNKKQALANINEAQKEVIRLAKITIGELQQTVVDDLKEASDDGRLSNDEIDSLNKKLVDKTLEKLSRPAYALLEAASVDISALITGAGESWIRHIRAV